MPAMMVWPVSSSDRTWKVGSSSASRWIAVPSFSWSALLFGSIATEMTGAGNVIDSRITGLALSQSVSPVVVSFRPITATIMPAMAVGRSSRLLACIWKILPMRSLRPLVLLSTDVPVSSVPE